MWEERLWTQSMGRRVGDYCGERDWKHRACSVWWERSLFRDSTYHTHAQTPIIYSNTCVSCDSRVSNLSNLAQGVIFRVQPPLGNIRLGELPSYDCVWYPTRRILCNAACLVFCDNTALLLESEILGCHSSCPALETFQAGTQPQTTAVLLPKHTVPMPITSCQQQLQHFRVSLTSWFC